MRSYKDSNRKPRVGCCSWKVWRHYLCTAGWFPVFVAPIVTTGFLLSAYSSAGCHFIDLNVGFTPNNVAWNQSHADLGLFYYYDNSTEALVSDNKYRQTLHEGCVWYTDEFNDAIVSKDRTWKVARVMAYIAVAGSLLATLSIWFILLTPMPVKCLWPGVLLPGSMLAFIAEGSKFLFFDLALCRTEVWFPSGADSLPEKADSCELGQSAYIGIAAGALHLVALLAVCMKSPKKRKLDPNYATNYGSRIDDDEVIEATMRHEDPRRSNGIYVGEDVSMLDDDIYTAGSQTPYFEDDIYGEEPQPSILSDTPSHRTASDDEVSSTGSTEQKSQLSGSIKKPASPENVTSSFKPESNNRSHPSKVSESRIAVMSKMQLQTQNSGSSELIATLVHDLDQSLGSSTNIAYSK